jgi:hypothetical protein
MSKVAAVSALLFVGLGTVAVSAPEVRIRRVEGKVAADDSSAVASGSGVLVGKKYILTNRHVVRDDDGTLYQGFRAYTSPDFKTKWNARVISICENYDLALIETVDDIPFNGIEVLDGIAPLAAHVTAYGFPLGSKYGVGLTTTGGQISRHPVSVFASDSDDEKQVKSSLWHDAFISHGSSGGPLFSDNDILVGINFASLTNEDKRAFAIPSDVVAGFLRQNNVTSQVKFVNSLETKHSQSTPQAITVFVESMGSGDLSNHLANDEGATFQDALVVSLRKYLPGLSAREFELVRSGELKFAFPPMSANRVNKGDIVRIVGRMDIIQILESGMLTKIDEVKFVIRFPHGGGGEVRAKVGDNVIPDVPVDSLYFVGEAKSYTTVAGRDSFAIPLIPLAALSEDEAVKKAIAAEKDRRATEEEERRTHKYRVADGRDLTADEISAEIDKKKAKAKEDEAKAKLEVARAVEEAKFRTWTSVNGSFTTKAKLISYSNGVITIETHEGKKIKVPLEKLSKADNAFVTKWRKEH